MGRQRRICVTPQRKRKPDYRKLSAALQAYLAAQAEAEAEAQATQRKPPRGPDQPKGVRGKS